MDIRILSVIISASVAIFITVFNHFIYTPIKEKCNRKREQLKTFYAPLYGLVIARIYLIKPEIVKRGKIMLGGLSDSSWLNNEYMDKFIVEKTGYASYALIEEWMKYSTEFRSNRKKLCHLLLS